MKLGKLAAVVAALVASSSVGGATWTGYNSVDVSGAFLAAGTSIYCATTNNITSTCQTGTSGLSGSIVKLIVYSTSGSVAGASTSPQDTTDWISAQLRIYSGATGGISIANTVQGSTEIAAPQHAIDNWGLNDILGVDSGWQNNSTNWDVSEFTPGYMCMVNSGGTGCTTANNHVNVDAWIGGDNTTVFGGASGIHFTANNQDNIGLSGGFKRLPLSNDETPHGGKSALIR